MKLLNKVGYCFIIPCFLFLTFTNMLWAADKTFEDSAELSYVQTGGNTDVLTFSGNNTLKYRFSSRWAGAWKIGALYGKTDGEENAERYYTDLRADCKASDRLYYYGLGGWFRDKFSGIDNRYYLGPGVGYHILTGDRQFLSTEVGLNYANEEYANHTRNEFMEGRLFGKYEYVFNPKTKFSQIAEYLHNFSDSGKFRINSTTAVTTMLSDMFSLKLSYEINYNNKPTPDSLKQTDTIFSVALVVNF